MKKILFASFLFIGFSINGQTLATDKKTIKIYLDADRTRHVASARSIEMGVKTAFSEINNTIQGYNIEFVALDHRGNSKRSKMNMDKAFNDPQGLLVFAGLHSPPLIKNRSHINENKMLTLVPWAAGGPITRHPSADNWVFRLSIDDTKAGYTITNYAIKDKSCKNPHLLLEQTPWGESNKKTMTKAMADLGNKQPEITWFNWGLSEDIARIKLRDIHTNADCILFVGNANDGKKIAKAMISLEEDKRLPIYSHWGITGGNFTDTIDSNMKKSIDLSFIQTCFSFVSSPETSFSKTVFETAQKMFPELKTPIDIKAAPGFIHAYDLSRILIQAMSQTTLSDNMTVNRENLKTSLENLKTPVQGLIKTYEKPFSIFSQETPNAHEALDQKDFCMSHYGHNNEVIVLQR